MIEGQMPSISQLRWHCRRGMLELDILLNTFLDKEFSTLTDEQSQCFEVLLDYPDQVLFDLLLDKMQASDNNIDDIVKKIRKAVYQ